MNLKIYGCRGSVAISRAGESRYGGNTSCMVLSSGEHKLIVDAGSGIMQFEHYLQGVPPQNLNLLISHLHLDHIIGLSAFAPAYNDESSMKIFTSSRSNQPLKEQLFGIFEPPYWSISAKAAATAECIVIEADKPFIIGPFTVTAFIASHSDQTLSFHITDGHKTFVHLLDSEISTLSPAEYEELLGYCKNADLVVFDAAYSPDDYDLFKGWGHSTIADGIRLANDSNCKRMLFAHFSQIYSDSELDNWKILFESSDRYIFAHDGLELSL